MRIENHTLAILNALANGFAFGLDMEELKERLDTERSYLCLPPLTAVSKGSVFGGMGSWNDLPQGQELSEYHRVSSALHQALIPSFVAACNRIVDGSD